MPPTPGAWQDGSGGGEGCAHCEERRGRGSRLPGLLGVGGGAREWGPRAWRRPSPGLSLPSRGRDPGAGFQLTAWVRWAPGSLNETANLPARDYIKESPPPAAPGA